MKQEIIEQLLESLPQDLDLEQEERSQVIKALNKAISTSSTGGGDGVTMTSHFITMNTALHKGFSRKSTNIYLNWSKLLQELLVTALGTTASALSGGGPFALVSGVLIGFFQTAFNTKVELEGTEVLMAYTIHALENNQEHGLSGPADLPSLTHNFNKLAKKYDFAFIDEPQARRVLRILEKYKIVRQENGIWTSLEMVQIEI